MTERASGRTSGRSLHRTEVYMMTTLILSLALAGAPAPSHALRPTVSWSPRARARAVARPPRAAARRAVERARPARRPARRARTAGWAPRVARGRTARAPRPAAAAGSTGSTGSTGISGSSAQEEQGARIGQRVFGAGLGEQLVRVGYLGIRRRSLISSQHTGRGHGATDGPAPSLPFGVCSVTVGPGACWR